MIEQILRRDAVIERIARENKVDLESTVKELNQRLKEAKRIPVVLALENLGGSEAARHEVLRNLKDAGWTAEPIIEGTKESGKIIGYNLK